jgi:hypothetical protein
MAFFRDIANPLIQRGIPVIPLKSHSKDAFLTSWEAQATSDSIQIEAWDKQYPDANVASVAKAAIGGFWFLEIDGPAGERLEQETGQVIPDTFRVRSSPGRGHFYWKQNARSMAMGNIAQGYVKSKDWSARVHNQYVVGPGSWHPKSGRQYEIVSDAAAIEAPDWLIDWCLSQKTQSESVKTQDPVEQAIIPDGARDVTLTSIAGKLYRNGLDESEVYTVLSRINQERCQPPLDDSQVKKIAHSIAGTGRPRKSELEASFDAQVEARAAAAKQNPYAPIHFTPPVGNVQFDPEIDDTQNLPYPQFPREVMCGTSLYEGFVKPVEERSDKYPELLFMPAVVLLLNEIFGKVHLKASSLRPNMYLGIIGPYGNFFKSTCCEMAHGYFMKMDRAMNFDPRATKTTDGKIAIVSVGSPEGFGKMMAQANTKHAILYYDELSKFVGKANIESSSFVSDMLSFYESRPFGNLIKAQKDSFSFEPGSYCFSWMWCTTDRKFPGLWGRIPGDHADFDNRLFFLLTPEREKSGGRFEDVDCSEGAAKTRKLIDAAISKKVYDYDLLSGIDETLTQFRDARDQMMLQVLSLFFAIDLGREVIDDDCVERAFKLVRYRQKSLAYLDPATSDDPIGSIMKQVIRELRRNGGKMKYRDLYRNMDAMGKGMKWESAIKALASQDQILYQRTVRGVGQDQRPAMVYLLKQDF